MNFHFGTENLRSLLIKTDLNTIFDYNYSVLVTVLLADPVSFDFLLAKLSFNEDELFETELLPFSVEEKSQVNLFLVYYITN